MNTWTRKRFTSIIVLFLFTIFNACVFTDEPIVDNYLTINGTKYTLSYGVIDDDGTNTSITGRYYDLYFRSSSNEYPKDYIKFRVLSTSTSRLQEDTYSYDNNGVGELWGLEAGFDLKYDATMNAIEGKRIYGDSKVKKGVVNITRLDGYYVFDIDAEMEIDKKTYIIKGYFTGLLHQESVY